MSRVIYDFGAHSGADLPYYLSRAERVVAVEANPELCDGIERRFAAEIAAGRLFLERCALSVDGAGEVPFYLHRHDVGSQLPRPIDQEAHFFRQITVAAASPVAIIEKHGPPHYVKIDLEGYDPEVLRSLFAAGIVPPFISAESHRIEVFCLLAGLGAYRAFNLVEGASVAADYGFPPHSAGPFGDDLRTPWSTAEELMMRLCMAGLGWRDIHARR